MLAERDRNGLIHLLGPTFERMRDDFDVKQFHFHIPPSTSFLRLHKPDEYGDDIGSTRKTVQDSLKEGRISFGLERGATGLGVRGVVPVLFEEEIVGSIEIGHSFGDTFLEDFKKAWGTDIALYEITDSGEAPLIAAAGERKGPVPDGIDYQIISEDKPFILISPAQYTDRSFLFGPVKDYSDKVVAIVRMSVDRSEIQEKLARSRNLMLIIGLIGIAISFALTYLDNYRVPRLSQHFVPDRLFLVRLQVLDYST